MKGKDYVYLKECLSVGKSLKICILDNNSVEFLNMVCGNISPDKIFSYYDIIIIPQWVWIEVCDSDKRKSYINNLKNHSNVLIINEVDYLKLVDYKEAELYFIFLYCCYNVSRLVSFIKKDILKNRPVEELDPYEEWLRVFYEEGLDQGVITNDRIQRKNAGEISISVLSYIISYYFSGSVDIISIFSSDRDTYEFVSKAKEMLNRDERFRKRSNTSITFKSNDFLIYEWTRLGYLDGHNIDPFVNKHRQSRKLKYTRKKQDNSIEERDELIENTAFIEILRDSTVHLIF